PDRAAAAGLLRTHVVRRALARQRHRPRLRSLHDAGIHRGGQQLRTRHRRRDRYVRRDERPGAGRSRRPADRGARPRGPRLRLPVGCTPLGPHQPLPDRNEPPMTTGTIPTVLFVCVHNAGRSQMAAAFLTHIAEGRVEVRSAGSEPADQLNPAVVEAMREVGIDITAERPKLLTTDAVQTADVVITMGCGDTCPIFPGKRYEDWQLDDPAGRGLDAVRVIRDDIENRVRVLISELLGLQASDE